jgi:hypothetical protein
MTVTYDRDRGKPQLGPVEEASGLWTLNLHAGFFRNPEASVH